MKFTLSWLKEYLDTDANLQEIDARLTAIGLEVEEIEDAAESLKIFTVAEIISADSHPDADKLQVCKVNNGSEELQIVCGAPNARAGIKVILASVGARIPNGDFKIKKSKIRGVESVGMMCSASELNIGGDADGIVELPSEAVVGQPFASFMGLDDPLIEIAITPNRGDCLGVYGIARDLAASGLGTLKSEGVTNEEFGNVLETGSFDSPIQISIENEKSTPYFIGRTIKGVKNGESPAWLKARLESIGLTPISTLVDITNFMTFAFGRPAHVFDASKISGNLVARDAKDGEKLKALDDKEYSLEAGMTVISDDNSVQALGGIMGGLDSGVTEETTDVFLEIALFDPIVTATTGRKLQIESDARYRFERTVPASTCKHFITATNMIIELCGGEASKPTVAGSVPMERPQVSFRPARVKELIGMEVDKATCVSILEKLGFNIEDKGDSLQVGVPSFRPDVTIEADLVEEVTRIVGYDKIPAASMPSFDRIKSAVLPRLKRMYDARRALAIRGLDEVMAFSFMSEKDATLFAEGAELIQLANPISADLSVMAPSLLPNMLNAAARNGARGAFDVAFFEMAMIFHGKSREDQEFTLTGIRTGNDAVKNVHGAIREVDVFDAKADALAALASYNVTEEKIRITRDVPSYFHPGRSGAMTQGKNVLAYFGEIHPAVLKALDVKTNAVGFEVFVDRMNNPKSKKTYSKGKLELSNFQSVERDFAFIVNDNVAVADIIQAVKKADKNLLKSANVFDIYQGKGVEEGKKSVALSIKLQPKDRTLTDEEIEAVSAAVIANVEKAVGGVLR